MQLEGFVARPIFIQMGLFGAAEVAGTHLVAAHTRVLADGNEVFVGEHLRWDRGRRPVIPGKPRGKSVPHDHPSLFDVVPAQPTEPLTDPDAVPTCPFGMPGATQLHLWEPR